MSEFDVNSGDIVDLTVGEYGDFASAGVVRALESFSLREAMDAFLRRHHPEMVLPQEHTIDAGAFIAWLEREGLVARLPVRQVHIQSWGGNVLATPSRESYVAVGDPEPLPYEEYDVEAG